jgi:hypothetical protein
MSDTRLGLYFFEAVLPCIHLMPPFLEAHLSLENGRSEPTDSYWAVQVSQ